MAVSVYSLTALFLNRLNISKALAAQISNLKYISLTNNVQQVSETNLLLF